MMSVTDGSPRVSVPVLSSTTALSFEVTSRASAPRKRMPCSAALPTPTITAVGAASPMAQGQAIRRTAIRLLNAKTKAGAGPQTAQTPKVTSAMPTTAGTKTAAIRSASCWIGGFEAWACSTSLTIWANAVSLPTLVASKVKAPVLLRVAPKTAAPGRFSTGRLSPVSIDSSTADAPSRTMPSTGIFSPGRTTIQSPTWTCSMGVSSSTGPASDRRSTRAVFA